MAADATQAETWRHLIDVAERQDFLRYQDANVLVLAFPETSRPKVGATWDALMDTARAADLLAFAAYGIAVLHLNR